jgi:hypothetical protein
LRVDNRNERKPEGACAEPTTVEVPSFEHWTTVSPRTLDAKKLIHRYDRRCGGTPSLTNLEAKPRSRRAEIGKRRPSAFTVEDMQVAVSKRAA